jgi:NADH-quinone oxidoreductase subunit J
MAAWSRHILYAIIGLGVTLFGLAGLFLHLGSPFVAAMQLLIYLGGITVAIVFAMMLSIAMTVAPPQRNRAKTVFAGICSAAFAVGVLQLLRATTFTVRPPAPDESWSVAGIGHALLTHYNLVFETLSVVLLLAIIGAILIARPARVSAISKVAE